MNMRALTVASVLVLIFLIVTHLGCAAPSPEPTPTPAPTPKPAPAPTPSKAEVFEILVGTTAPGSSGYIAPTVVGDIVWRESNNTIKFTPVIGRSGAESFMRMRAGETQMCLTIPTIVWQSCYGKGMCEGEAPMAFAAMFPYTYGFTQFFVRADSPIKTIYDIKEGMVGASGPVGSTGAKLCKELVEILGLDPDEMKWKFVGYGQALDAVKDGTADWFFAYLGIPYSKVLEVQELKELRMVSLPEELKDAWNDTYFNGDSVYLHAKLPNEIAGYKCLEKEDYYSTNQLASFFIDENKIPEDIVYQITKIFWENHEQAEAAFASFKGCSDTALLAEMHQPPFAALAKGSIKYYREKGWIK